MSFKKNDVVQLKSGGPEMTILWLFDDPKKGPMAHCHWWDKKKEAFSEGDFTMGSLREPVPFHYGAI